MMNEHNHEAIHMSNSVINNPAKRRRGRPRKEGHFHRKDVGSSQQASPINTTSETVTKSLQQSDENMIGKPVSGVIDGCFDAGFFLTVKIGNNGPILRGVVFEPGKVVPLTSTNDIAPQAKLHQRREIPVNQAQNQFSDIGFQSEKGVPLTEESPIGPGSSSAVAVISLPSILSNTSSTMNQTQNFKYGSHFMMPSTSVENLRMVEQDDVMQVYEVSVQSDQRLINPETESGKTTISSQSPARQSDVMGTGLHLNLGNDFLRCNTDSFLEDISAKKPHIEVNQGSYFSPQQQNTESALKESGFQIRENDISDEHLQLEETSIVAQTQDNIPFKDHQRLDNDKNLPTNEHHTRPNPENDTGKNDGSKVVDVQGTNNNNSSGVTMMPLDLEIAAAEESTGPGRPEFDFSSSIGGCNNEREN